MVVAARVLEPGGRADGGKGLVPPQPDRFVFGEIFTLDGESHQPVRVVLLHVEREKHNVGPADCPDIDKSRRGLTHEYPPLLGNSLQYSKPCATFS